MAAVDDEVKFIHNPKTGLPTVDPQSTFKLLLSGSPIETGCPVTLEANKSHKVFIPEPIVGKMLERGIGRSLMANVQDELWRNVYSKEFLCSSPSK